MVCIWRACHHNLEIITLLLNSVEFDCDSLINECDNRGLIIINIFRLCCHLGFVDGLKYLKKH